MTKFDTLNVILSNSQLNKLKYEKTILLKQLSSNVVVDSNDENNFPHKFLLTNTQVLKLRRAFANNNYLANITQLNKTGQSGGFSGRCLGPSLETKLPLMKNLLKPLAKNVLIPLGLTAPATVTDPTIHNKFFRYFDQEEVFSKTKYLKGKGISISESLASFRLKKLKEAREKYGFKHA